MAHRIQPSRRDLTHAVLDMNVRDLNWIDDQYFAGFGARRRAVADCGPYQIESYTSAEGETRMMIYRSSAMTAAFRRSAKAGGGARGLCSDHLLDGEAISLPSGTDLTVAGAIAAHAGTMERRAKYRAEHDEYLERVAKTGLRNYIVTNDTDRYVRFFEAPSAQEAIQSMMEVAREAGWPITTYVVRERRQTRAATDDGCRLTDYYDEVARVSEHDPA